MSNVTSALVTNPYGKQDECAKFDINSSNAVYTCTDVSYVSNEYVFTAWVKSDAVSSIVINNVETVDTTNEWVNIEYKYIATSEDLTIKFVSPGTYYLYNTKLEIGNTPTDWSPSPMDAMDDIEEASKVATNFLGFSTDGLIVGDLTDDEVLDGNVRIASNGVEVRKNEEVLSKFTDSDSVVGKESGRNVKIDSVSVKIRNGSTVLSKFGEEVVVGQEDQNNVLIKQNGVYLRNASTVMGQFNDDGSVTLGETSGNNVRIDSDSVDIRNGSTVLSSFTGEGADLGLSDEQAIITFCDSLGSIRALQAMSLMSKGLQISSNRFSEYGSNIWTTPSGAGVGIDNQNNQGQIYVAGDPTSGGGGTFSANVDANYVYLKWTDGIAGSVHKLLWSGNAGTGAQITIPSEYKIYIMQASSDNHYMLGLKSGNYIAVGSVWASSSTVYAGGCELTLVSGETWKLTVNPWWSALSGGYGTMGNLSAIYGVL